MYKLFGHKIYPVKVATLLKIFGLSKFHPINKVLVNVETPKQALTSEVCKSRALSHKS